MTPVLAIDVPQDSRVRGVQRTFSMLLWRRRAAGAFAHIPKELHAEWIEEYAQILTQKRLEIDSALHQELRATFASKYAEYHVLHERNDSYALDALNAL